jgi:hypothetical protein
MHARQPERIAAFSRPNKCMHQRAYISHLRGLVCLWCCPKPARLPTVDGDAASARLLLLLLPMLRCLPDPAGGHDSRRASEDQARVPWRCATAAALRLV